MKKLNKEIILKIVILICFEIFFIKLLITNEIKEYVHPRIIPFVILCVILMIGMIIVLIRKISIENKTIIKLRNYIIFLVPIALTIFIQSNHNYSSSISNYNKNAKISSINSSATNIQSSNTEEKSIEDNTTPIESNQSDDAINVNASNFVQTLNSFLKEPDKYDEKSISMDGFIYTDDKVNTDYFVLSRYMMVCCAADMQIVGIRCNINNHDKFDNNVWVKVSGKLKKDSYEGQDDLIIIVDSIQKDNSPNTSYVYPF